MVTVVLVLLGLALLLFVSGARVQRQDIGHVGVVRNGGPLDNRSIRQVLLPGAGVTWAGWFSQTPHEYPARSVVLLYTITSDAGRGHRPGADRVTVPTRDGVQVGIEGTVYYHFVGEADTGLLKKFDKTFGTRKYSENGPPRYPYEGDAGFQALVDSVVRPVLDNDLRRQVGAFDCAALVTACSLVRRLDNASQRGDSNRNTAMIQDRINASFESDLAGALGGRYIVDVHFRLVRVTLPPDVQRAVDDTQAASADVHVSQERLRQGTYEARRNELLGKAYNKSPGLANINAIRAAPRQSTVIINTGSKQQSVLLGGK
jgi:regulator of protease activity HflC (stomatin/prohibitin superfamily)